MRMRAIGNGQASKNNAPKAFFIISLAVFMCTAALGFVSARKAALTQVAVFAQAEMYMKGNAAIDMEIDSNSVSGNAADIHAGAADEGIAGGVEIAMNEDSEVALSWLGLPQRKARADIAAGTELVPLGMAAGVIFQTDGVMVLGTSGVTDKAGKQHYPAEGALKAGDLIMEVDGNRLDSKAELIALVEAAEVSKPLKLTVNRDGVMREASVTPVPNVDDVTKLGVWVRDGTQGIGTVTYYNPETMAFGALGHGIADVDTKKLMPVRGGQLMESRIVSIQKGKKGGPGELVGEIAKDKVIGRITANTPLGLYGQMTSGAKLSEERMRIALQNEIHEGPAKIRATVSGRETKEYDVYIESVNRHSADEAKGMVIRITDTELIAKTNGIVQGMSGSPIVQDGKFVGAVTHVFVQNPHKGYGIFIENMLRQERSI